MREVIRLEVRVLRESGADARVDVLLVGIDEGVVVGEVVVESSVRSEWSRSHLLSRHLHRVGEVGSQV